MFECAAAIAGRTTMGAPITAVPVASGKVGFAVGAFGRGRTVTSRSVSNNGHPSASDPRRPDGPFQMCS